MNFNFDKRKILKILTRDSSIINVFLLILLVVFFNVVRNTISKVKITDKDIKNYKELTQNQYNKFENVSETEKLKKIIQGKQFQEMKIRNDVIKVGHNTKDKNLFKKNF